MERANGHGRAVAVVAAVAAGLLSVSVPTAGACGLPLQQPCPTGPPIVAYPSVKILSDTSVEAMASVDPKNNPTSVRFSYYPSNSTGSARYTPDQHLQGSGPMQVSATIAGLQPTTSYDLFVIADDGDGNPISRETSFRIRTPPPPRPLRIVGFRASPLRTTIGEQVTFRAHILGNVTYWQEASGYTSLLATLVSSPRGECATAGCSIREAFVPPRNVEISEITPDRNTRFRLHVSTATSSPLMIYVFPVVVVSTQRPNPFSPGLTTTISATVHQPPRHYHPPWAYVYESTSRRGPFSRVGSARFHLQTGSVYPYLVATVNFNNPGAVYTFACTRRPIMPDMGTSYRDPWCGRPTLP